MGGGGGGGGTHTFQGCVCVGGGGGLPNMAGCFGQKTQWAATSQNQDQMQNPTHNADCDISTADLL